MINSVKTYQPSFTRGLNNDPHLQKLIDSVDVSLIKTQKLRDSFESIGANDKPVVVVIDSFKTKVVDINDDNINDLSHGETVSLYTANDANILPIERSTDKNMCGKSIKTIYEAVNNGANIKAINISLAVTVSNDEFYHYLLPALEGVKGNTIGEKILAFSKYCNENSDSFKPHIGFTKSIVDNAKYRFYIRLGALYKELQDLENLPKLDIPVYLGAGNETDQHNLLDYLLPDAIIVAANKPKNTFSCLYNRFEQGFFYVTELIKYGMVKGYDIDEDGKLDVRKSEVSSGQSIMKRFIGKRPNSLSVIESTIKRMTGKSSDLLLATGSFVEKLKYTKDNKLLDSAHKKVYGLEDVNKLELDFNRIKKADDIMGDFYVPKKTSDLPITFDKFRVLRLDDFGKMYFDPLNTGIKNAMNYIVGTSFASPTAIKKDIQAGVIK